MANKFVGLIILDGFGLNKNKHGNAILQANPVNFLQYYKNNPSTTLDASGESVGLLKGTMGGSETGHLNMGAGKVVEQKLRIIEKALNNKEFYSNKEINATCEYVKQHNSNIHIMGLLSDKNVHGNLNHMFELLNVIEKHNIKNVYIHCFLDGRDTYVDDGVKYIKKLQNRIKKYPYQNIKISTLIGRSIAMDREQNYDKTEKAYKAMVLGNAEYYSTDPIAAVKASYDKGVFDEFVEPIAIVDNGSCNTIKDYDGVFFYNFRDDRARQITQSFIDDKFNKFPTVDLSHIYFCGFSQYDVNLKKLHYAFADQDVSVNLSRVISEKGLKQFKISETTKYAHVTYFLNGGIEKPYKGEERFLIETVKNTPFDKFPQMRTVEITDKAIEEIKTNKYSFMALNYSNCDMLGHTGNLKATIESVKILDRELKRLIDAIISIGGVAIITADHGNAEKMLDGKGKILTEHTTNKVPFTIVNCKDNIKLKHGKLANIAPTVLDLLGIEKPAEFEENSLIEK